MSLYSPFPIESKNDKLNPALIISRPSLLNDRKPRYNLPCWSVQCYTLGAENLVSTLQQPLVSTQPIILRVINLGITGK